MSRIVRSVDAFYEATGPYSVDKTLAEGIFETTFGIVSDYTGRIALNGPRGVRIPTEGDTIHPWRINLGTAAHTMLLTRRVVDVSENTEKEITGGVCDPVKDGSQVKSSKTIVRVLPPAIDPTGGTTIFSAVHEVGHSFGLKHCEDTTCVMFPEGRAVRGLRLNEIINSGQPFLEDCAEDLELASYLALAETLA